jgi:hypothetical protein
MKPQYTVTTESYFTAQAIMAMVDLIDGENDDIIADALQSIHYFLDNAVPSYYMVADETRRESELRESAGKFHQVKADQLRSFIAKLRRTADDMEFMQRCASGTEDHRK